MKNQIKLFCIALAGAFMLTACGGPKLIGVTLPETPLVLATGETATAETSYTYDGETPENAQPEVVYTSGDATIATVDENGVITGVAEGETTITATVGELSASRTVSVIIPVERLEAESMMLHLADGPASLTYTVVPENFTGELTFASANNAIVTVDANGQITPGSRRRYQRNRYGPQRHDGHRPDSRLGRAERTESGPGKDRSDKGKRHADRRHR